MDRRLEGLEAEIRRLERILTGLQFELAVLRRQVQLAIQEAR